MASRLEREPLSDALEVVLIGGNFGGTWYCRARFVAIANGPLHRPRLAGIPGLDTFKRHTFAVVQQRVGHTLDHAGSGRQRAAGADP